MTAVNSKKKKMETQTTAKAGEFFLNNNGNL